MIDTNVVCDYCGKKITGLAGYLSVDFKGCSPIEGSQQHHIFHGEFCGKSCFLLHLTKECGF